MPDVKIRDVMDLAHGKVGVFRYDHAAAAGTRFGQSTGNARDLDWKGRLGDCSGTEIGALVAAGWVRYTDGFPESSGSMAQWAVDEHPELLMWSHDGKGLFPELDHALQVFGAIWILGGYQNGDAGHTGWTDAVKDRAGGFQTTECASSLNGMAHGSTARFRGPSHSITHVLLAPGVDYALGPPDLSKIPTEDTMPGDNSFVYTTKPDGTPDPNWYLSDGMTYRGLTDGEPQLLVDAKNVVPVRDDKGKIVPKFVPLDLLRRQHYQP